MAEKPKLSGGTTVVPNEYDKFVKDNIGKAVIGIPGEDGAKGDTKVMNNMSTPSSTSVGGTPTNVMELPVGLTPEQQVQMQTAFKAIMQGVTLTPNAVAAPPPGQRDIITPDTNTRMWNPMQVFQPTAKLSDMERGLNPGAVNPNQVMTNAPVNHKLTPRDDCPQVLIDCYLLLKELDGGRWCLPGSPSVATMITRLKSEIEAK